MAMINLFIILMMFFFPLTTYSKTLLEKVRLATILGTIQATLVNFKYVSSVWRNNCEEERLLGVSLTGIMDNKLLNGKGLDHALPAILQDLRNEAVRTNEEFAKKIGINQSVAVT
jgi:ribonucleoside-diphosphate reductase alpha chain